MIPAPSPETLRCIPVPPPRRTGADTQTAAVAAARRDLAHLARFNSFNSRGAGMTSCMIQCR